MASALVLACTTVVLFGSAGVAVAQEQDDPLRLVFLNSDPLDGSAVYDAVAEVLEASGDVELIDPGELLSAGDDQGVELETFRDGEVRDQNADVFEEMLAETRGESIMVLDVFSGGNTMQLVLIGPYGDELEDIRQSIAGSRPTQRETVAALKQAFRAVVPDVRRYREEEANRRRQEAEMARVDEQEEERTDESVKERVVREHRQNHADLKPGLRPHIGMIFGRRSLLLETEANYHLDHASPFLGLAGEVDAIFALMDGDTAAIGATFYGAYAPFTTEFKDDTGVPQKLASSYSNFRLDLKYIKGVGPDLVLHGMIGVEMMSVGIDQNQAYTGNDYMNLRAGGGMIYQFGHLAELHLDAAVLPTLSAKLSDDAMGTADLGWGVNGTARLHLSLLKPLGVSVGYDLHYYNVTFPAPNHPDLEGLPASTGDTVHGANLMIGYGF